MSEKTAHELQPQRKPEFDGSTFTIEYLLNSSNGFEVLTDKSGRRRNPINPENPLIRKPMPLTTEQREQLKRAIPSQMKFAGGDKAAEALITLRNTTGEEKVSAIEEYEQKRKIYLSRAAGNVGLRNIRKQNNILTVDIKPIDFPTYKEFSKPESSADLLDSAVICGTSIIIITKDNRLILQLRSPRNTLYGEVPGTSAAGFLDGRPYYPSPTEPKAKIRGTLQPIDTDFVTDNILRETKEEIGLDKEDLFNLKILGLARDNIQITDLFMFVGTTNLTFAEVREKALNLEKNFKLSEEEFYEKFVDMPATPEAISTLLTKVKCPVPPALAANYVATGYSMVLEKKGQEAANTWKNEMEAKIKQNYKEIERNR